MGQIFNGIGLITYELVAVVWGTCEWFDIVFITNEPYHSNCSHVLYGYSLRNTSDDSCELETWSSFRIFFYQKKKNDSCELCCCVSCLFLNMRI